MEEPQPATTNQSTQNTGQDIKESKLPPKEKKKLLIQREEDFEEKSVFVEIVKIISIFLTGLVSSLGFFICSSFFSKMAEASVGVKRDILIGFKISMIIFAILSILMILAVFKGIANLIRMKIKKETDIKRLVKHYNQIPAKPAE